MTRRSGRRSPDRPRIRGVDRLFRHLVPDVTGRRSGHEIIERLRRKWDLGHSLHEALDRLRGQVHALAELRGPAGPILDRLDRDFACARPRVGRRASHALLRDARPSRRRSRPHRARPRLRPRDRLLHPDDLRADRPDPGGPRRGLRRRPLRRPGPGAGLQPRRPRRRLRLRPRTVARRPRMPARRDVTAARSSPAATS